MAKKISRREFMKTTAVAGGAAAVMPQALFSSRRKNTVKLGFIGTGMRGQWMLWLAAKYPEVEIPSICDIDDGMIDAALKLEGEDSASIAKGFGAAIGGIGTERFKIEQVATTNAIPILAIVIKQTIHEAITLMSEDIANQAKSVRSQVYEMITENSKSGETVMIVGVGNTLGVGQ